MNTTYSECSKCRSLNKINTSLALQKKPICGKCQSPLRLDGLVSEVGAKSFQQIMTKAESLVLVDFWASWCGPCKAYAPEYQRASIKNQNVIFLKINTDEEQQISAKYSIRGIPCTILFKNGVEIKRQSGVMSTEQIEHFIRM